MYKKSQQPVSSGISSPIRVVPLGINAKLVPDVGPEGALRSLSNLEIDKPI